MRAWVWGVAAGLAGCVSPGSAPVGVATVRAEPKAGIVAPAASGETQLIVRAFAAGSPAEDLEGAACVAEAPWFHASFTTPARVLMPDYGASAPTVSVTCHAGTASGTAAALPVAAWSGGLGGWPALGISVGTGTSNGVGVGVGWYGGGAGGASGVPVTRYSDLRVELR